MASHDVSIYEPCRPLTVDNSTITVDATWITADAISLPAVDLVDGVAGILADVIEPVDATDEFDAVRKRIPFPGFGGAVVRPAAVVGVGYGVLPALEGEAHGVVYIAGDAVGALPAIVGDARGEVDDDLLELMLLMLAA